MFERNRNLLKVWSGVPLINWRCRPYLSKVWVLSQKHWFKRILRLYFWLIRRIGWSLILVDLRRIASFILSVGLPALNLLQLVSRNARWEVILRNLTIMSAMRRFAVDCSRWSFYCTIWRTLHFAHHWLLLIIKILTINSRVSISLTAHLILKFLLIFSNWRLSIYISLRLSLLFRLL